MKKTDKNKVILLVSAILIVVSILITLASFIYEKNASDTKTTKAPETTASDKIKDDKTRKDETKKPDQTKQDAPEDTTKAPETTKKEEINSGDNKPGTYIVNTENTGLGLRNEPKKGSNQSSTVDKGKEVKIIATYNGWGYYHTDTQFGWLPLEYLKLTAEDKPADHSIGKYKVVTDSDKLIIREEPENFTAVRGRVPNGEEVEILTVAGDWGYVQHSSGSGWLTFDSLEMVN